MLHIVDNEAFVPVTATNLRYFEVRIFPFLASKKIRHTLHTDGEFQITGQPKSIRSWLVR
jgi:hypothetical protein